MGSLINRYFRSRIERYYLKNKWHIVLDLSLIMIIFILAAGFLFLHLYRPALPEAGGIVRPPVDLNNPPLEIRYDVVEKIISPGEPVHLDINLKNPGQATIRNVAMSLQAVGNDFTLSKLEGALEDSVAAVLGRNITISHIEPGEEKSVKVTASLSRNDRQAREIEWQTVTEYILNGQQFKSTTALESVLLTANLSAGTAAYYTSPQGDQLGIGPIPPIVGIPTEYWVFWDISSTGNFTDLSFSARLPRGVELTGDRSLLAGNFNYNPDTRQIIWKIPALSAADGPVRMSFEIRLIPSDTQLGLNPILLEAGKYFGIDSLTRKEISGNLPALDTGLKSDRFNAGRGEVIAQ